jgi:hypothetical protein
MPKPVPHTLQTGADFYGAYSTAENADRPLFEIIDNEWVSYFRVRPQDVGEAQQTIGPTAVVNKA